MAWQTPKTNWTAGDVPVADDFNRIEGNIQELQDTKETIAGAQSRMDAHLADNIHIPKGLIAMWSGLISEIPSGWALCDGTNGTPNLKDRFIMGATTDATINKTGGQNEVTLTVEQMPSHSHTGSISSAGSHTHSFNLSGTSGTDNDTAGQGRSTVTRSLSTSYAGSHTHTVTISNTGSGQPHENRPAYYTLAFIMKL